MKTPTNTKQMPKKTNPIQTQFKPNFEQRGNYLGGTFLRFLQKGVCHSRARRGGANRSREGAESRTGILSEAKSAILLGGLGSCQKRLTLGLKILLSVLRSVGGKKWSNEK